MSIVGKDSLFRNSVRWRRMRDPNPKFSHIGTLGFPGGPLNF